MPYQISPDAFCEVNFEVEGMQFLQTVEWIKKGFDDDSGNGNVNENGNENSGAILVVSGRDINSYG